MTTFCAAFAVDREIDVAAAAALDFANDLVTVEIGARFEQWSEGQFGDLPVNLVGLRTGQLVDPHDLQGQVVAAALLVGFFDDAFGRAVEIAGAGINGGDDEVGVDMFIDAIGGEQENIALFYLNGLVIDIELAVDAQSAGEMALRRGDPDPVIFGQLLEFAGRATGRSA